MNYPFPTYVHHNLLDDYQFGFQHKYSTVSVHFEAAMLILWRINGIHCVSLDLANAFDSVSHLNHC